MHLVVGGGGPHCCCCWCCEEKAIRCRLFCCWWYKVKSVGRKTTATLIIIFLQKKCCCLCSTHYLLTVVLYRSLFGRTHWIQFIMMLLEGGIPAGPLKSLPCLLFWILIGSPGLFLVCWKWTNMNRVSNSKNNFKTHSNIDFLHTNWQ